MFDISSLASYREGSRLEAKAAQGGLPKSVWETYSAFANTSGGVVLLGVKELADHRLAPVGLPAAQRMRKEFWDALHGGQVVSANILTSEDVRIECVEGMDVLCIFVPEAQSCDQPVYVRDNPFTGSYRRNGEGDYRCSQDEVKAMIRGSEPDGADKRLVLSKGLDALCAETLIAYRQALRFLRPQHPWNDLPDEDFLIRIEAARRPEGEGALCPTRAGLLMFGWEYEITGEFPYYFLDYREVLGARRWDDRVITSDGEWSGNVFDFWRRASVKLVADLPRPFELDGLYRQDDTPMHRALREALANTLIHTDYHGNVSSTIVRYDDRAVFTNAGVPLIAVDVAEAGGVSKTRNPALMKMFNLLSIGERAGSGFDTMKAGCVWAGVPPLEFREAFAPDRTILSIDLPRGGAPARVAASVAAGAKEDEGVQRMPEKILPAAGDLRDGRVLELAATANGLRRADVERGLGVSKATANNLLKSLVAQGRLEQLGSGPATRYRIVHPTQPN